MEKRLYVDKYGNFFGEVSPDMIDGYELTEVDSIPKMPCCMVYKDGNWVIDLDKAKATKHQDLKRYTESIIYSKYPLQEQINATLDIAKGDSALANEIVQYRDKYISLHKDVKSKIYATTSFEELKEVNIKYAG
jgi:hypothetical protein